MRYYKAIERIKSGTLSREELLKYKNNAETKLAKGDKDAKSVLSALEVAVPKDTYILFMGFCPNADIKNRLDTEWKEKNICRFDYIEDSKQLNRFKTIYTGDLVVLKKVQNMKNQIMRLYGHGRVKSIAYDSDNIQYLNMDWSSQDEVIDVPLMACVSTVDIRSIERVNSVMPEEFYKWIES